MMFARASSTANVTPVDSSFDNPEIELNSPTAPRTTDKKHGWLGIRNVR
jgi:hypothetical protein